MPPVDGQEVLGARAVDGDRLLPERSAPADAAVVALPGVGGRDERIEPEAARAAGDGDAGSVEADADVLRGMADERGGGIGCAEGVGEEGRLTVAVSQQCGACEECSGRGERGDEREHSGLPNQGNTSPMPQSIVVRHVCLSAFRRARHRYEAACPLLVQSTVRRRDLSRTRPPEAEKRPKITRKGEAPYAEAGSTGGSGAARDPERDQESKLESRVR